MHSAHIARLHRSIVLVSALTLTCTAICLAQSAKPSPTYPTHLPYAFSNFVWWTDADLRAQLKKQIPGLGDEIAPDRAIESKIRDVLKGLLKQKGVVADVMTEEPSPSSLTAELDPGVPAPAIVFSILNPQVLVDQVILSGAPDAATEALNRSLKGRESEYSSRDDWYIREQAEKQLQQSGYFDAQVNVDHDAPRVDVDQYRVNLVVSITPGPQYHIGEITGDGGPLLKGRDHSTLFKVKPGDIATSSPLGKLAGQLLGYTNTTATPMQSLKALLLSTVSMPSSPITSRSIRARSITCAVLPSTTSTQARKARCAGCSASVPAIPSTNLPFHPSTTKCAQILP